MILTIILQIINIIIVIKQHNNDNDMVIIIMNMTIIVVIKTIGREAGPACGPRGASGYLLFCKKQKICVMCCFVIISLF